MPSVTPSLVTHASARVRPVGALWRLRGYLKPYRTQLIVMFAAALGAVAAEIAIPLLTNRTIAITKGTALASVISVPEILDKAQSAMSLSANASPLVVGAGLYLAIFGPLVAFSRWLERRFGWIT